MQIFVKMLWKMQEKYQNCIDIGRERIYNNKCYQVDFKISGFVQADEG